jgi:hypothetical protein
MNKLPIDINQLAFVMEMHDSFDSINILDTETGEILNIYRGLILGMANGNAEEQEEHLPSWEKSVVEKAKRVFSSGNGRYQEIPQQKPAEHHELMVRFARSVRDRGLKKELNAILNNGATVRGFLKAVTQHPEEYHRWFSFSDERMKQKVLDWLGSLNIQALSASQERE